MDVYVVSSCWWRDGATVIGAAVERRGAEAIADRAETDDHRLASWAPWKEEVLPINGQTWRRDALMADGTTHSSLYQEIVCVPLAGVVDTGDVSPGLAAAIREEAMMRPVFYPTGTQGYLDRIVTDPPAVVAPPVTRDRMVEVMEWVSAMPKPPGRLRVGKGEAWNWMQRAIDNAARRPAGPSLPDSIAARIMGIDIVLDPELPPNMMKLGPRTYAVDGDRVFAIDEILAAYLSPS